MPRAWFKLLVSTNTCFQWEAFLGFCSLFLDRKKSKKRNCADILHYLDFQSNPWSLGIVFKGRDSVWNSCKLFEASLATASAAASFSRRPGIEWRLWICISSQTYTDFGIRKVDQVVESVMRDVFLLSKVVIVLLKRSSKNVLRNGGLCLRWSFVYSSLWGIKCLNKNQ